MRAKPGTDGEGKSEQQNDGETQSEYAVEESFCASPAEIRGERLHKNSAKRGADTNGFPAPEVRPQQNADMPGEERLPHASCPLSHNRLLNDRAIVSESNIRKYRQILWMACSTLVEGSTWRRYVVTHVKRAW